MAVNGTPDLFSTSNYWPGQEIRKCRQENTAGFRLMNRGDHMQKMFLRLAPAVFFISLTILVLPDVARAQSDAAKVYKTNCVLCHAADGSGNSPSGKALKAKDLKSDDVQKQTDAALSEVITKGRGKMPAFGSKLSPDVINSLVAYIRQLPKK
jgi:mono/diheme cytochrome c family protein